jgi:dethiobiotin synthetase
MSGFFITGVDTGAGKTTVTASLIAYCKRKGMHVGYMKPIETGVDPDCYSSANSDAQFLAEVAGDGAKISDICPVQLKTPASPYQACLIEGTAVDMERVLRAYRKLESEREIMLVEGIGGLSVPISRDRMLYHLVREIALPILVVAPLRLGALNHVLLTLRAAREEKLAIAGIILVDVGDVGDDPVLKDLGKMIAEFTPIPVLGTCPYLDPMAPEIFSEKLDFIAEMLNLNQANNWLENPVGHRDG